MKTLKNTKMSRCLIKDISPAGKELTEEHLRMAAGGLWNAIGMPDIKVVGTKHCERTCVQTFLSPLAICFQDCTVEDDGYIH